MVDEGMDQLTLKEQPVKARHYVIKGRYTQDVWYDEQGRLVHTKLVTSDGSVIEYQLI